jgi:hypothetical protein
VRILDRILLLNIGGPATVLEVVDPFRTHEFILDFPKVYP